MNIHKMDGVIKLKHNAVPTLFDVRNPPAGFYITRKSVYKNISTNINNSHTTVTSKIELDNVDRSKTSIVEKNENNIHTESCDHLIDEQYLSQDAIISFIIQFQLNITVSFILFHRRIFLKIL